LDRGPDSISFNLAQALTGSFQEYLFKMKRARLPDCMHCNANSDSAEHTLFVCPFWENDRAELRRKLGRSFGPRDVQMLLCGSPPEEMPTGTQRRRDIEAAEEGLRTEFMSMVDSIMGTKQALERTRQRIENQNEIN
jgi:hypothetical protein